MFFGTTREQAWRSGCVFTHPLVKQSSRSLHASPCACTAHPLYLRMQAACPISLMRKCPAHANENLYLSTILIPSVQKYRAQDACTTCALLKSYNNMLFPLYISALLLSSRTFRVLPKSKVQRDMLCVILFVSKTTPLYGMRSTCLRP
jgi:hypothetical protein